MWRTSRKLSAQTFTPEHPYTPHSLFFEVIDTGSGIAPSEIDVLFEAFGQTETGRQSQQGTGLGLAISRKYVQLMGGNITVESTLGVGSKFSFNIQIYLAIASQIQTTSIKRQIIGLVPLQPQYRILVVDDARDSRLLLVKLLTSIGFPTREAANGAEAIAVWHEWRPQLILMDMRMPVMDGYEATREIKAREIKELVTTIIIALTANAFEEQRQEILEAGCDDLINKPFKDELLLQKLNQYLGVEYIYLEEDGLQTQSRPKNTEILTNNDLLNILSQMPSDWSAQVYQAAAAGSDVLILELLKQIPPENTALINHLRDLANNFQFERIMELVVSY
ncbi:MAG: response regulator [Calothrix sp. SM1_7_51]|nr:response regulator [Calothrix sp. SM1_7_51]